MASERQAQALNGGTRMSKSTRRRAKMKRRKRNAIKGECNDS